MCAIIEGVTDSTIVELFLWQAVENPVYRKYLQLINCNPLKVKDIGHIPFLPIETFKFHMVKTGKWEPEAVFESSGSTGQIHSYKYVRKLSHYHEHAYSIFSDIFGSVDNVPVFALLPSYLQRKNSSLVSMLSYFIQRSGHPDSGFFLHDHSSLAEKMTGCLREGQEFHLWGVTYALLDFAAKFPISLGERCLVFETGGMKGRREEWTRHQVHSELKTAFSVPQIFSEYGMTELMSQAYTQEGEWFEPPPSMRILIRDIRDPFEFGIVNKRGGINIIDMANTDTCAFIETQDVGLVREDGCFRVLGRLDEAEMRGCSLMIENNI